MAAAKGSATRLRRARTALLAGPKAVAGLPDRWQPLLLRIVGERLPGATCGPYTAVRVGLQVGRDGVDFVAGDALGAEWRTTIEVRDRRGVPDFRGPAVQGPAGERFVYLTWHARRDGAPDAMFRRAKLRLDAVPAEVVLEALAAGALVGRLPLTGADGTPLCAAVRPPVITWST